jgi:hypothetical protein
MCNQSEGIVVSKGKIIGAVAVIGIFAVAGYFFLQAQQAQRDVDTLRELTANKPVIKENIWIGADECKTTFGANTIAFCDGVSEDTSLFLEAGADAAVKQCFEYTAEKMGLPTSSAVEIACQVKEAYQDRKYSRDSEADIFGIFNNNYNILNEWVNR